jgi:predicted AlkP superfamily pyrophosphatase or phosphodiesterase
MATTLSSSGLFRMKNFLKGVAALVVGLAAARADTPKLVVTIIVDQMRYDYLERFEKHLRPDGFRLLTEKGAFMTYARYNYFPTVTGPGHASYLSGSTPALNGIVGNDWYDRKLGKTIYCAEDPTVHGVGGGTASGGKRSPRNLIGATVADQLRLHHRSKVVGISLKDRGAIFPAGKRPAGAYWVDGKTGDFVTSTYYMAALPAWVEAFNNRKRAASFVDAVWDRLLDVKEYLYPDETPGEGTLTGEDKPVFPHQMHQGKSGGYEFLGPTPYGNQLLEEFAEAAIEGEHLGEGAGPDMLCISFSSIDGCGHVFGPYSQEVEDITLRLDIQLSTLFRALDKRFGLSHVMIALTADHGVAPTPEMAAAEGLDGQRFGEDNFAATMLTAVQARYGPGDYFKPATLVDGMLYFNRPVVEAKKISPDELARFVREAAIETGKIEAAYTREQLLDGRAPGLVGNAVLNGFNPERSGDVVLIPKPFVVTTTGKTGTSHGTPYNYDTHVPVMFFGKAFRPGRYADEFSITDLAPTLCAALHIEEPPGCMGKPFVKALAEK